MGNTHAFAIMLNYAILKPHMKKRKLRFAWRSARNRMLLSLSAIQAVQLILPLFAIPWLGRALGPDSFGLLMYMCLVPPIINLFMDWGFVQGATREVAKSRQRQLAEILGEVIGAKIILAGLCAAGSTLFAVLLPYARQWPGAYCMAVSLGIARGISPLWFFQGLGKGLRKMAAWDILSSLAALALTIFYVNEPAKWPYYLFFSAICKGVAYLWLNMSLWRAFKPCFNLRASFGFIKTTNTLFICSLLATLYNNGAQLLMGFFLSASNMGIIAANAKMLNALTRMSYPIAQTVYPKMCALKSQNSILADRIMLLSTSVIAVLTFAITLAAWVCAPFLIGLALGNGYEEAIPAFRIMITAAPFLALRTFAGNAIASYGLEKSQAFAMGGLALICLPLAVILAIPNEIEIAALYPVCESGLLLLAFVLILRKDRRQPDQKLA